MLKTRILKLLHERCYRNPSYLYLVKRAGKAHILFQTLFVKIVPTNIVIGTSRPTCIIYLSVYIFRSIARGRPLETYGTLVKACLEKRHCTRPTHITRCVAQNIKEHQRYYNTWHSFSVHIYTSEKCNLTRVMSAHVVCT